MVPRDFISVAALPRTPSGKLDRRALTRLDGPAGEERPGQAPCGSVEESLSRIWSDVLGVGRVGAHDSFFDLGGHSLHAARLVARVADQHGVWLPLRDLFERPTVAAMAEGIAAERGL